ncbi:primosomal protein N' (replication factor Y) - superfamily II helicase [Thioclava sp. FR2]|uniref:primosomal protein N' (replication factor Y) - superfamily II helicase n=1 Tax=Thioclava sp. FR2 TaxID=3445780 RepID=UPI003EB9AA8C
MSAEEHRWPCAQCGADLRFSPEDGVLKCDHCGYTQALPDAPPARLSPLRELDLYDALKDGLAPSDLEQVRITPCPSCGAQVEFRGATHATECPFCATPVAIGTGTERRIKPQALLPFAIDERTGREEMVKWLGNLWFAPNGLVEYARKGRALSGLYVPYWTFDAATRSRYSGARGEHYYETRTVTVQVNGRHEQRQERVQKTRWYNAAGWVSRRFDDILVLASTSIPRRYTDALAPWNLNDLTPYNPDYLAGFTAEGYTVSLSDGQAISRQIMAAQIDRDVRADIGGDEQRVDRIDTAYSAETFKHILLPIWMAAYKYNGKTYRFVVNGQTGKVQGERPWSAWKIAFAVLLAAVIIGTIIYFNQNA